MIQDDLEYHEVNIIRIYFKLLLFLFIEYCVKIELRMSNGKKVGVVGSGLVGKSWAMIFASQGYQVRKSFLLITNALQAKKVLIFSNVKWLHLNPHFRLFFLILSNPR